MEQPATWGNTATYKHTDGKEVEKRGEKSMIGMYGIAG
jgi:hypothetical protein